MSLPRLWVDELFKRLSLRYGQPFMAQYRGLSADDVKADWGDLLRGIDGKAIAYALDALHSDKPPNALQFRDLCRAAPAAHPTIAIAAPKTSPGDRERIDSMVSDLRGRLTAAANDLGPSPARTAARLRALQATGARLTLYQLDAIKECERVSGAGWTEMEA